MALSLQEFIDNAKKITREMSSTQRLAIIMVALTAMAWLGFMVVIGSMHRESERLELPPEVAAEAWDQYKTILAAEGLHPEYSLEKSRIIIPSDERDRAMLALAKNKLSGTKDHVGFEKMLEKINFSVPEPNRRAMMQVAKNNELSQIIRAIDEIQDAQVIIDKEEDKFTFGIPARPRAAVKVRTKLGKSLNQGVADTIIFLVANSTAGLEPKNVVVADQHGKNFRAKDEDDASGMALDRKEMEKREAERKRDAVEDLCRRFYPGAEAFAFVDINLDMDKKVRERLEKLEGPKKSETKYSSLSTSRNKPANVTGTQPNTVRLANAGSESGGGTESSSSVKKSETNYDTGHEITRVDPAPGDVKSLSISVVLQLPFTYDYDPKTNHPKLDEKTGRPVKVADKPLSDEKRFELASQIMKAAGLKSVKDVEISQVSWRPSLGEGERDPTWVDVMLNLAKANATAILLALLTFGGMLMIWSQIRKEKPPQFELPPDEGAGLPGSLMPDSGGMDAANAAFEQLREKVATVVSEDPKKAASLVKRWLVKE